MQKKNFKWHAVPAKNSPDIVVVLIGESHRRQEFFDEFNRQSKLPEDQTLFFNNAISQYGYTARAMPMILSRKPFGDKNIYFNESSIINLFKEAGYQTSFISYLDRIWTGDDSINSISVEAENYYLYHLTKIFGAETVDDRKIIPHLKNILKNDKKKHFIVIKMVGLHWPEESRYPDEYDIIKPSLKSTKKPRTLENKTEVLNSYKNGMNFSVSVILDIFDIIKNEKRPSLMFFSSDHGVCLADNIGYQADCKKAFDIPFIIFSNDSYYPVIYNNKWEILKSKINFPITEHHYFETISSLSGISHQSYLPEIDLTSTSAKKQKRNVELYNNQVIVYENMKE